MTTQLLQREAAIVVVDPVPDDYLALAAEVESYDLDWRHFETADDLLRYSPAGDVVCWIIHAELPDVRGIELARMLPQRPKQAPLFVVTNAYRAEIELDVLASGVGHYACKPLPLELLLGPLVGPMDARRWRRHIAAGGRIGGS